MLKDFVYEHWVPMKKPDESFPFSFSLNKTEETNFDFEFEYLKGNKIGTEFKQFLINHIDFLNVKDSYIVKLTKFSLEDKKRKVEETLYVKLSDFVFNYKYVLVKSIDHLKEIINVNDNYKLAFDTETSGLNPEADDIVGLSFSFGYKTGYYVPIKHAVQFNHQNLGDEALRLFYNAMVKADVVYMFNSRFDMRMMEYAKDKFDMSKVNVRDVQITSWFADPDFRKHNLKYLEKHFLGYYRPDLLDTLKNSKLNNYNTALISPENILFYAAQDAVSTFELGEATETFYKEFENAALIDHALLYPLMKMENHGIRIDTLYLKEQLDYILPRLDELNEKIKHHIGDVNLNSPKQKIELFKTFKLNTGVKTKTGSMATGTKEVEDMIERLEAQGKPYPEWLKYLGERAKLEKLQSTFFGSLMQQAELNKNRVRINYRNTQAATGRMSSGADFGE
jgi:DNA polymerase-1